MSAIEPITVYVCRTCRHERDGVEPRPGARLHARLEDEIAAQGLASRVHVAGVDCLAVCKRPVTIGVTGPDRWTYLYGDLDADGGLEAIVAGLRLFARAENGIVPWRERPDFMKRGIIARIPPFPGADNQPNPLRPEQDEAAP